MRRVVVLLLALLLALSSCALGEGSDVPVDAFLQRAGVEADAALREKVEAFLRERYITAPMLDVMDDARLKRYARHLSEDLPIAYSELLEAPKQRVPEDAEVTQLAVLLPQGAAVESLLADFERGWVYYDETFPVPEDVCRAQRAGALSEEDGEKLLDLLQDVPTEGRAGENPGVELSAIRVAVAWAGGAACWRLSGNEDLSGVRALLDAGRAAAQGDE